MGIGKTWTTAETDYLESSWGSTSITGIANKLNRSVSAIRNKAFRIGLGNFIDSGDDVSLNQIVRAFGNWYSWTVAKWIKAGIPVKNKKIIQRKYRMVNLCDFWKWAEQHKNLLSFKDFELNALGKEPAWVDEKRKADQIKSITYKNTPWTSADDAKLITMLNQYRYSYTDISRALSRTEGAIKRRFSTLGIKQRPLKRDNRFWTDEEVDILIDLKNKGYEFGYIGSQIGRSGLSCRGKYELTQFPDRNKRYYRRMMEEKRKAI